MDLGKDIHMNRDLSVRSCCNQSMLLFNCGSLLIVIVETFAKNRGLIRACFFSCSAHQ